MIKELAIRQYRGFYSEQKLKFAIPDGLNNGSGLTVIVGPNNSGKTTILEALTFHNDDGNTKRFNSSERHKKIQPFIKMKFTDGSVEKITNISNGSQVMFMDNIRNTHEQIEFVASRRHWESQFSGAIEHYNYSLGANKNIRRAGDPGTASRIATINTDTSNRAQITNMMKRLVPGFTDWTVDSREPSGDYIKYTTGNGVEHSVDMMGDGIISLFRICAQLVGSENSSMLVIDEPELSLHPWAQKELHAILAEFAKHKQIAVVTHSPHFIDWNDLLNGAKIIRLNKIDDKQCKIYTLDAQSAYVKYIKKNRLEYQKPEILDVVAKEILFSEKMLFVEGKEDMGILRKWIMDTHFVPKFEIFGYGVAGETNMKLFLKMSEDLGLRKVAALFDNNATSFESCRDEFPKYMIRKISTDDIRDKTSGSELEIFGLFESNGEIKESSIEEVNQMMNDFNAYFES